MSAYKIPPMMYLLSTLLAVSFSIVLCQPPQTLSGRVEIPNGSPSGAKVRIQATSFLVFSDKHGRFQLPRIPTTKRITAWKKGYAITAAPVNQKPIQLRLSPLPLDNPDYHWIDPTPNHKKPDQCGNCHGAIYREWASSAHARSATNPYLLAFFAGHDWRNKPDPTWNVQKENPLGAGVCASCHAPTYRDPTLAYDLMKVESVAKQGVHCDYCHKIADASTDKLGTRFGKDGYTMLRNKSVFFGPLDDAFRPGDMFSYASVYRTSRYCASCHEGVVFGVHVYGTYSEWLTSPARKKGEHCQSCHMTPTGKMTNIAPGKGGVERDPKTLSSHYFPGGNKEMLRRCLKLAATVENRNVNVTLRVENVGHSVPTGYVDRHLILVVEAFDAEGKRVVLQNGDALPKHAGPKLHGKPGHIYAKQLFDEKGNGPIPFWLPVDKVVDTRLKPGIEDRRVFTFGAAFKRVRVRVIYRRFWESVARRKRFPNNEQIIVDKQFPPLAD